MIQNNNPINNNNNNKSKVINHKHRHRQNHQLYQFNKLAIINENISATAIDAKQQQLLDNFGIVKGIPQNLKPFKN